MILSMNKNTLTVSKSDDKERYYSESAIFHAIKKMLNSLGHDLVKKSTQSDGHMFGDNYTYYLRDRQWNWCIIDGDWMLRILNKDFNTDGSVSLQIVGWTYHPITLTK